jgi:hypothetical protein
MDGRRLFFSTHLPEAMRARILGVMGVGQRGISLVHVDGL